MSRKYCNGYLYASITMDVITNNYLQNLYVSIAYLKWPYGSYNRKDVGIACLVS
jgi:hypothetical protein